MVNKKSIATLLSSMIAQLDKVGAIYDVVVVGSDKRAEEVRGVLVELGLDLTVIADDKISPNTCWITSLKDLGEMPCGGRN